MFDQKQKRLAGTFGVSGHIVTADVNVTMRRLNRGTPIQLGIGQGNRPYLVPELQTASNLCELALEELEELGEEGASMHSAGRVLDTAWDYLRQARDELSLQSKSCFPRSTGPKVGVFSPPLPPELVLEFSVRDAEFVVSAFAIVPVQKPNPTPKSDEYGWTDVGPAMGQIVYYDGAWVEVQESVEHRYEMRELNVAADAIERAWHTIGQLRDHLLAHSIVASYT